MKGFVPPDLETDVSKLRFAVVRAPRSRRHRIPAACVSLCQSAEQAMLLSADDPALRPAQVLGPSKSSEGQYLYYLMKWMDE